MERLIELYNIASPSGKEKRMAKYIMAELKKMGVACRKDRTGNIYAVKGNADTYPVWWHTSTRCTATRPGAMAHMSWPMKW